MLDCYLNLSNCSLKGDGRSVIMLGKEKNMEENKPNQTPNQSGNTVTDSKKEEVRPVQQPTPEEKK